MTSREQRYRLGPVTVSRIGFGAMQLPGPGVFGPPRGRGQAIAVLRRAAELGADNIDTAQLYGPDVADQLIKAALDPYPEGSGAGQQGWRATGPVGPGAAFRFAGAAHAGNRGQPAQPDS